MAAVGSWFGAAIGVVISPFRDIFSKHAMFCFNTGKYVRDHHRDTQTLIDKRRGVQGTIRTGIPNGLIATDAADSWLERASKAISEEETNRERYDNRGRIFACCSLNFCANYKIGKKAHEARREVEACLTIELPNVTVKGPPPSVKEIPIQSSQLPSQESILQTACESINNQVGMIGIWGPDGVGNTLLLKKINNSFVGPDPPYFVIFVTASGGCSVQNIQDQIIHRLEVRKDDVAANPATNISELLRTRDFLLLLDGLYDNLDLLAVGIPHPLGIIEGQFKRKVIITSQSKTVCDRMAVDEYIEVPGLGETEALELFAQNVCQEDIYSDPHIGALANDLAKQLKGVPSDLIHFGKQMVGKSKPGEWEDVIRTIRKSNLQKKDQTLVGKTLRNLEDATNNLVARIKDVDNMIKAAEREGKTSTNEVNKWLEKADMINSDVEIFLACNKLKEDVTTEAIEKLSEIQECLRACPDNDNIASKSVPHPAQEIPGPSMSAQNRNLKEALRFIRDDPVGMIGIRGQGGVGKTYLLNSINNSIAVAGGMPFHVIFVTASRGCSVEKIQGDFLVNLGMKADGNVESQRQMIFNFLKKRSFLLLLDDLWEQIDLQAVGVPYPLGTVNQLKRKVVLTTRLREVCGYMEVRKELKVTCLQEDEAWQLFQEKVGQETLFSSPLIEDLARELVNELKGLPLALTVIGRAMYGKEDPGRWESAIRHMQLSRCEEDDPEPMKKVFKQLKFSYDSLQNKTLRDSFLTCALWPEDWKIPKVDLAQCWMGLGLVAKDDVTSSYRKAYNLIGVLRDASLLESWGNMYGYVKVHDVIRDMALWISCGCGEDNDKWFTISSIPIPWSKVEYISLMRRRSYVRRQTKKFPPDFNPCPVKLKMVCLQSSGLSEIAKTITNFTSLTYLDLSWNHLENIPDELCSLVNLEYLDLSHNHRLIQMPRCFRNLIKLKFLYLLSSGIETIPEGVILNLKALQVIDLRTCQESPMRDRYFQKMRIGSFPAVFRELGALADLKAASIAAAGFAEYGSLRGAANLPIRSLSLKLLNEESELRFCDISSLDRVQENLYELDILESNMKLIIVTDESVQPDCHFPTLNRIFLFSLRNLEEIRWTGGSSCPASVFPRLTYLHVAMCNKLEHLSWVIYLPCLEQLEITFCKGMKQVFLEPVQHDTFRCLKRLLLSLNLELVTIGDRDVTFPSLERLVIDECPKLERLPFHKHNLPLKLQELRLDNIGCWNRLECEEGVKSFLQPSLKFGYKVDRFFFAPEPSCSRFIYRAQTLPGIRPCEGEWNINL